VLIIQHPIIVDGWQNNISNDRLLLRRKGNENCMPSTSSESSVVNFHTTEDSEDAEVFF
jgi:hypothetical protein